MPARRHEPRVRCAGIGLGLGLGLENEGIPQTLTPMLTRDLLSWGVDDADAGPLAGAVGPATAEDHAPATAPTRALDAGVVAATS